MNKRRKLTLTVCVCGLFAALSVVIILVAHIPTLTYAVPAFAGALNIVIFLEFGPKSAFTVYSAVSVLSFLLCEKEAFLCYVLFFGYYPILKAYIERIKTKSVQWIVKIAEFTIAFAIEIWLGFVLFGIPIDDMEYGLYGIAFMAVAFEVMFVLYDILLTRVITLYFAKYRVKLRKALKLDSRG